MESGPLKVETVVSTPFSENAFVIYLSHSSDCVVIDPGLEPEKIIAYLDAQHLNLVAILLTHGHSDHIGGVDALMQRSSECDLVIGENEVSKLTDPMENLSPMFGFDLIAPAASVTVADGDTYSAAGIEFEVREIPGHTTGHVVFLIKDRVPMLGFVGDVIFSGSIGRTDFPGGSMEALVHGIHNKLFTLPDDTLLYSGHGPVTTVGQEKRSNPFVGQDRRGF